MQASLGRALDLLQRAALPSLAFLVSIAYWPGTVGAVYTPRWAIMSLTALVLFFRPIKVTLAHLLGSLFVLWACLGYLWSASPEDTIGSLYLLLMAAAVFCAGSLQDTLRPVYAAMAIGLGVSGLIAIAQMGGWQGVIDNATPSGLFGNRNFYAEICALVFVALIAERMWAFTLPLLPGLLLTGTRGAWLAAFVAIFVSELRRVRDIPWQAIIAFVSVVTLIVFLPIHHDGLSTIWVRLDYWSNLLNFLTTFGQGLGTAGTTLPLFSGQHWEHPHNEFLEIFYETGVVGLALVLAFGIALFRGNGERTEADVLLALAIESLVAFPLRTPATLFLGAAAAGFLARSLPHFLDQTLPGRARNIPCQPRAGL